MTRWGWLVVLLLVTLTGSAAAAPDVRRFALVIGNNQPEDRSAQVLRYADDDAVATHAMLLDAKVKSLLFVTPDETTRSLNPRVAIAGRARLAEIERGYASLLQGMKAAVAAGQRVELLFFYSGHGDVDGGEGYVTLEGQRLTRTQMFSLLSRSPAASNHVFVDACKSYFLVFDRGPGGRRTPYARAWSEGLPAKLANSGFVLSTSSDRESHEWERYQGGILSHQLRSALRGAADVDLDGSVSYAELGAFLSSANRAIVNPKFKPDFLVRAPGGRLDQRILSYGSKQAALKLRPDAWGHFYVENARGERLLDAHPGGRQPLQLFLPDERPLFVRRYDEQAEYVLLKAGPTALSELAPRAPELASRGALSLALEGMFSAPFSAADVALFRTELARPVDEPATPQSTDSRATVAQVSGVTAITAGLAGVTLSALAWNASRDGAGASQVDIDRSNRRVTTLNRASLPCYGVALGAGLTWAWASWWPKSGVTLSTTAASSGVADGFSLGYSSRF